MEQVVLICVCSILQFIETRVVYYSNVNENYTDALKHCQDFNGTLLSYGRDVVEAANKCEMTGHAWLGKPWLKQSGCYEIDATDYFHKNLFPASFFECATICDNAIHKFIGITNETCICLESVGIFQKGNNCSKVMCSNKTTERCGVDKDFSVKEKVYKFDNKDERQTFQRSSSAGKVVLYRMRYPEKLKFFCVVGVGQTSDLRCFLPSKYPTTTKLVVSNNNTPVITITQISNTTAITISQSNAEHPAYQSLTVTIFGGVTAAVVLVTIVVLGLCCKQRCKTSQKERMSTKQVKESSKQIRIASNYELPPDTEVERENEGVYDHTNHTLLRNHDEILGGNIYDHNYTVEGVYDTAAVKQVHSDNTYGHSSFMNASDDTFDHEFLITGRNTDKNLVDQSSSKDGDINKI